MGVESRLNEINKKIEEEKRKRARDFYMEEEETLMYKPQTASPYINREGTTFKGFGESGINVDENIFNSQAVFDTRET